MFDFFIIHSYIMYEGIFLRRRAFMYLSMVVFEECLAEYHPRMTGHSDLIKIKFMGVQEAIEGQEYLPDHMLLEHVEYFVSHPVPAAWG